MTEEAAEEEAVPETEPAETIPEVEETEAVLGDKEKAAEELGDLMFSCVNVARKLDLDAEELLSQANEKFLKRFEIVEKLTVQDGEDITKLSPDKLEEYWQRAKKQSN